VVQSLPWEEHGGCLLTGQAVTGVKVARARFRLQSGVATKLRRLLDPWHSNADSASCAMDSFLRATPVGCGGTPCAGSA